MLSDSVFVIFIFLFYLCVLFSFIYWIICFGYFCYLFGLLVLFRVMLFLGQT